MTRPALLEGVRVIDMSQVFAGPTAALHLADLGAEVIKLEPPWGEIVRGWQSDGDPQDRASAYLTVNRGKSHIAIDLRRPDGLEVFYGLIDQTDVLVTNLRTAAAVRLGLDVATLHRRNPRLIHAQITGYGPIGPEANRPAFDLLVQARSGVMSLRSDETGRPQSVPFPMADLSASTVLGMAICAALYSRERSGHGRSVETSLLDSALIMQRTEIVRTSAAKATPRRSYAFYNACRCADDRYLIFATQQDRRWREFCRAMDIEHVADAPEFATFTARVAHGDELYQLLEAVFLTRTSDDWIRRFREADVPAEIIYTRDDVLTDEQTRSNGMVVTCPDDYFGDVDTIGAGFRVDGEPVAALRMPGGVGADTAEILRNAGFAEDRIDELSRDRTIAVDRIATAVPHASEPT